jgi:DNA repair photolyase
LAVIRTLTDAGVPVGVLLAPVIPALNDHEIERMLVEARAAGARAAAYLLLRLPGELGDLFTEWLRARYPLRAERVIGLLREMRGGRLNDPRFVHRMRGEGAYAGLLAARFAAACRRLGLAGDTGVELDASQFRGAAAAQRQQQLQF